MAKQVLAASLWYHASFQRPSEQLLNQLSRQLRRFVASAQQASHSDDALALAQGNSQGSAQLPAAPGAALFPGELTSSLPLSKGGVGLVHVPTQVQALFFFFFLGYREDVHSMQAARPTKIPDEPMLCETPALSR